MNFLRINNLYIWKKKDYFSSLFLCYNSSLNLRIFIQHYLGCAIGFNSNIIQNDDWQKLFNISNIEEYIHISPPSDKFSFTIVPHTEDSFNITSSHGWSTIVLKDMSKISMVKTIDFDTIKNLQDIYFPLSKKNQDEILEILSRFHLEKYIDQVKLVVYSYCC